MDTNYFRYYNINPKNRITQDCVIRALCLFLGKPYNEILADLIQIYNNTGFHIAYPVCFMYYLRTNHTNIQKYNVDYNKRLQLKDLCDYLATQNNRGSCPDDTQNHNEFTGITLKNCEKILVLLENTHLTFVENSVIIDTWNCSCLRIVSYFVFLSED
jgi:hypothetical protein